MMGRISKLLVLAGMAIAVQSSAASAAGDYVGNIGGVSIRTGHANKSTYKHAVVIRNGSGGVVCAIQENTEQIDQFVSVAMSAALSGRSVTIKRGGSYNGQYKCYRIRVNY